MKGAQGCLNIWVGKIDGEPNHAIHNNKNAASIGPDVVAGHPENDWKGFHKRLEKAIENANDPEHELNKKEEL